MTHPAWPFRQTVMTGENGRRCPSIAPLDAALAKASVMTSVGAASQPAFTRRQITFHDRLPTFVSARATRRIECCEARRLSREQANAITSADGEGSSSSANSAAKFPEHHTENSGQQSTLTGELKHERTAASSRLETEVARAGISRDGPAG